MHFEPAFKPGLHGSRLTAGSLARSEKLKYGNMKVGESYSLQIDKSSPQIVTVIHIGPFYIQVKDKFGKAHTVKKSKVKDALQKQEREKQQKLRQLENEATTLAKSNKWQEVAEICLAWLQLSPEDLNPLSRLAWACYNLNQLEQAKKLYKNILASSKLYPDDANLVKRLIHEIEVKQGLVSETPSSKDSGLTE